jgi:hypothetical protein
MRNDQLRLGLGQVLRYAHVMERAHPNVRAVLVVERQPSDPAWSALCERLGVTLAWPGAFAKVCDDGAGAEAAERR